MRINKKPLIGFIGQGYVGKNYADDFEKRGYKVIRYAMEEPYRNNKEKIKECDIVFIAVPTPTKPEGFDDSILRSVIPLVGKGKIAVIKSTMIPGTTKSIQKENPDRVILHSPEFLREDYAAEEAARPFANIVGMPNKTKKHKQAAKIVHSILPKSAAYFTSSSEEAELFKYAHNASGYVQIVLFNLIYDISKSLNMQWREVEKMIESDPYISNRYAKPVHKGGRGAGGHCFIKDFAALSGIYERAVRDSLGKGVLKSISKKNIALLLSSGKDEAILKGVYGANIIKKARNST